MKHAIILITLLAMPTVALAETQLGFYLNQQAYRTNEVLALTVAMVADENLDAWLEVSLHVQDSTYYFPLWTEERNNFLVTVKSTLAHYYLLTFAMPAVPEMVAGYFTANLYKDDDGAIGPLLLSKRVDFVILAPTPIPTATPYPTASPTPTPATGKGWISGNAIIRVSGSRVPPSEAYDKGTIFSLDGPECQTAWVRHRELYGVATYQAKMFSYSTAPGECWDEVNYWDTLPCADGNWIVEWGVSDGWSWVNFIAPNGTNEQIDLPHVVAWDHITLNAGPCTRPSIASHTTATLISFNGMEEGTSGLCPY